MILDAEIQRLQAAGEEFLTAPYPQADREPTSGWLGDYFSVERALARASAVYEAAIAGYEQMVRLWFPKFAPRLRHFAVLPARLVGIVVAESGQQLAQNATYSYRFEPLPRCEQSTVEFQLGTEEEVRQLFTESQSVANAIMQFRPEALEWMGVFGQGGGIVNICQADACSRIVYGWLEDDLSEVKWLR